MGAAPDCWTHKSYRLWPDGASNMIGAKTGVATCINEIESNWHCHGHALQSVDGDTIKAIQIIRGSLDAAFELTNVMKCTMFPKP